jgi:hypothetical protein
LLHIRDSARDEAFALATEAVGVVLAAKREAFPASATEVPLADGLSVRLAQDKIVGRRLGRAEFPRDEEAAQRPE